MGWCVINVWCYCIHLTGVVHLNLQWTVLKYNMFITYLSLSPWSFNSFIYWLPLFQILNLCTRFRLSGEMFVHLSFDWMVQ